MFELDDLFSIGILIAIILVFIGVKCYYFFFSSNQSFFPACSYYYQNRFGDVTGPTEWKKTFPDSNGTLQSPINLSASEAIAIAADNLPCLKFSSEYNITPEYFKICNDGHTVVLHFRFPANSIPQICGGPLSSIYQFYNASFRWGLNEHEGSEHTIDSHRFALELQAMHIRTDRKYFSLQCAIDNGAILIISYFFEVVKTDNIYLREIIKALNRISEPFTCADVEPLPMSCIMPLFKNKYYAYCGSLTYPPCSEGVRWMIQPEPLPISYRQLGKFKSLWGTDGPILVNTRPVQKSNARQILFYV